MTKTKSTKRALLMSVLAMVLCVSMLIGTTFAWFTDSASSTNNRIVAGNLDIELYYQNDETTDWTKVDDKTNIFKTETLWEPGHTEVVKLKIANEGSLALKYQLGVNIASEVGSVNVYGDPFKLSDYIYFGVAEDDEDYADRDSAIASVVNVASKIKEGYTKASSLEADKDAYLTMVVYMPTTVGNEANHKEGADVPVINLGLNLFATQFTFEEDSFGNDYDKTAPWAGDAYTAWYDADPSATEFVIDSPEALAGLAKIVNEGTDTFKGNTIKLGANIDLNNLSWTPIGSKAGWDYKFNGSFYGNGYTIYNLYVTGTTGLGLFGYVGNAAHIEGVTIEGAYVSGNDYVGAVMGSGYLAENCLKNCTVMDATIIATPYLTADGIYDGGAKAGAIAGYAINGHISGNKAIDCTIMAYRDLGGIVGMVSGEGHAVTVSNNTVEGVTLSYITIIGSYDKNTQNQNMNDFAGRISNATVANDNIGTATKDEGFSFAVSNDTELATVLSMIKSTENFWGKEITIHLNANNYSANHVINQYPQWNGVVGAGSTANNYATGVKNAPYTNIAFVGQDGAVFTGNVTVNGFGNAGAGFGTATATTTFQNIVFDAANSADNEEYSVVMYVKAAANDVNFIKCTFKNATHVTLGGSAADGVGEVNFDRCLFEDGGCLSGYVETLNVSNSTVKAAKNGFINKSKAGKVTIENCNIVTGRYFVRTSNSGIEITVSNSDITVYEAEGTKHLVYFRGSNESASFDNCTIASGWTAEGVDGNSVLNIDGEEMEVVSTPDALVESLENKKDVVLTDDVKIDPAGMSNAYGKTGINVKDGQTIDGNGFVLDIKGAGGTWDSGINTTGGTIKNITVTGSFRGIFINHNSTHSERVVLENVVIDGTVYTISCDQGANQGLTATNCTFNGWTSYAGTLGEAEFYGCSFGEGNGYAFCRPYAPTAFVDCDFSEGFEMDPRAAVTFENCRLNGVLLTAENIGTLVTSNVQNATVK